MIQLNHKDLAYSLTERELFLRNLKHKHDNFVLLNTCNRVELYSGDGVASREIISHLFKVTSGIESAIVGETSIQGQVKQAYIDALNNKHLSKGLDRLFQSALRVGKIVRSNTSISAGAMSHSQIIPEILAKHNLDLSQSNILIIGVNNLNEVVTRALSRKTQNTIYIANRTYSKAKSIAEKYGCQVTSFDSLAQVLPSIDILISATSAPHLILKEQHFCTKKEMIVFDLACPRDIDPIINSRSNIELYNIEDIENFIDINHHIRKQDLEAAIRIIEEEVDEFSQRHAPAYN